MEGTRLRHRIAAFIILLYLIPILFFSGISVLMEDNWALFGVGLMLMVAGSIALIIKMWQWEGTLIESVDDLAISKAVFDARKQRGDAPAPSKEEISQMEMLSKKLEQLKDEIANHESELIEKDRLYHQEREQREDLEKLHDQLQQEFLFYQEASKGQLKQKDLMISEYSQTANELRESIEKKQKQISKLESSVHDLTYEVKTLLTLSDEVAPKPKTIPSAPPSQPRSGKIAVLEKGVSTLQTASVQLKRCIDIAQKHTGASHIGLSSRFRDVPIDSYALDQRRLFDTLRSETSSLVLVYSKREGKLLFANNEAKNMFGWSPDKFIHDFPELVLEGMEEWNQAISRLSVAREAQANLVVKSRSGQDQLLQCQLGMVPTGVFKNHVIAVGFI